MESTTFEKIVDFVRGLYGAEGFIPLHAPVFIGEEKKYLNDCIDSTFVSSVGKYVDAFEQIVASYTGAKKAIVIVNGTNALALALQSVGVERDSEVITQPLTFVATANAISYTGAHPVFLDVDPNTMGLSSVALETWLRLHTEVRENSKTKKLQCVNKDTGRIVSACVPMHTFGHPVEIDLIVDVCNKYYVPVVEDAAESLGSFYKGKHTGTSGAIGILSFNGNKIVTTGGGGMILTNDESLGNRIKHLTTQAKVQHPWEFVHDEIGYNLRMPNINAALGLAQMENIKKFIINKRETASFYKEYFKKIGVRFFEEPEHSRSNYWLNCILLDSAEDRDRFLKYSNDRMVMTRPSWRLMNKLPMFNNAQCDELINARFFEDRIVNIPSSIRL